MPSDDPASEPGARLRLSVLDQSPISQGQTGAQALRNSVDLASLTDDLGYHRYWVAEHHATPTLACAAPEVLIGPIASATRRIRVGSGGIMLPHYSPFKVAECFSVLSGLFPGRIDLALGRASGTDPMTTLALQRDRRHQPADDFPEQLAELLAHLEDRLPPGHPFARLAALHGLPERPEPWLLGSSPQSAVWAAQLGLPYAFADFISPDSAPVTASYRERFNASERLSAPRVALGLMAVCAETEGEAQRLASSGRMVFSMLRQGGLIQVPPVDEALHYLEQSRKAPAADGGRRRRRGVVGSPEQVRSGIEALAQEYGAEEVIVLTITYDHAARRRSYELIAEAFGPLSAPAGRAAEPVG
jgi:luciferase family oxidoreductase group 1